MAVAHDRAGSKPLQLHFSARDANAYAKLACSAGREQPPVYVVVATTARNSPARASTAVTRNRHGKRANGQCEAYVLNLQAG